MPKVSEEKVAAEQKRLTKERQIFLDDMFNDIYAKRKRIYGVNFFRGVFFGFGAFLGGTLVVAIIVGLLSQLVDWPFVEKLIDALQR